MSDVAWEADILLYQTDDRDVVVMLFAVGFFVGGGGFFFVFYLN